MTTTSTTTTASHGRTRPDLNPPSLVEAGAGGQIAAGSVGAAVEGRGWRGEIP